jgi:hypothetical protein
MKSQAKPTPRGIRKGVKGTVSRGKRPPSDEDEDLGSKDSSEDWSASKADQVQLTFFLSSLSLFVNMLTKGEKED